MEMKGKPKRTGKIKRHYFANPYVVKKGRVFFKRTDGMFVLRQPLKKKLEGPEDITICFIALKNAYDAIPREIVMTTLM